MNKCVVFDLDETIGHFAQLYKIAKTFEENMNCKLTTQHIITLYKDLYNIFRPGIFTLLGYTQFLKEKYKLNVVLYTNTVMDDIWISAFLQYTYTMVKLRFDFVIDLNSTCRTSIKKNLSDLYKCASSLSNMSSIIVIDNKRHKKLLDKNITYVLVKNYYFVYTNNSIWKRLHDIFKIKITKQIETNIVNNDYNNILKKATKNEILDIISKLKIFSNSSY